MFAKDLDPTIRGIEGVRGALLLPDSLISNVEVRTEPRPISVNVTIINAITRAAPMISNDSLHSFSIFLQNT
jgi:hypothetical protein